MAHRMNSTEEEDLRLVMKASHDYQEYLNELLTAYKDWLTNRTDTIQSLKDIVIDMDSNKFKTDVTQLVGSGLASGSSLSVLLGIALSTVTGGASLVLAEIGVVVDFLSGVTNLVTDGFKNQYATTKLIEADKLIKVDKKKQEKLAEAEKTFFKAFALMNQNEDSVEKFFKVAHITVLSLSGKDVYDILKSRFQSGETNLTENELMGLERGAEMERTGQVVTGGQFGGPGAREIELARLESGAEMEAREIELARLEGGAEMERTGQVVTGGQFRGPGAREIELARLESGAEMESVGQVVTARQVGRAGQIERVASTIGKLSGVLAAVDLGLNIWTIKCSTEDIRKGSKSKLGKTITEYISELERSMKEIEDYFAKTYMKSETHKKKELKMRLKYWHK